MPYEHQCASPGRVWLRLAGPWRRRGPGRLRPRVFAGTQPPLGDAGGVLYRWWRAGGRPEARLCRLRRCRLRCLGRRGGGRACRGDADRRHRHDQDEQREPASSGMAEPPGTVLGGLATVGLALTAAGPPIGGVLTGGFRWHSTFLINVPCAVLTLVMTVAWIPRDPPVGVSTAVFLMTVADRHLPSRAHPQPDQRPQPRSPDPRQGEPVTGPIPAIDPRERAASRLTVLRLRRPPARAARQGPVWSRLSGPRSRARPTADEFMLASLSTPGWRLVRGLVAVLLAVVPVTAFADRGRAMSHADTAGLPRPGS